MNQIPTPPNPSRPETEVIAENLRRLRDRAGLTQEEVAEKSGIPVRTIQRAEAGEIVRDEALECVSKVLGSSIEVLKFDLDNPPPELREAVDDIIAQMTGTGPWRHIPVRRILTPLDVETELINRMPFGHIPHKDPELSAEALNQVAEIMGWVKDIDCVESGGPFAWETAKSIAGSLETLDQLGGAMLVGTIHLTLVTKSATEIVKTPGNWLVVVFLPIGNIKPTIAFDMRDLPPAFLEHSPKTWTPVPANARGGI